MKPQEGWTLEALFAGRPVARRLFDFVRQYIDSLGPVKTAVTKTQVSFGVETKFAWVWLPQLWTRKRPDESITLTFGLRHRVDDARIAQAVEPRPRRWTHHVVIENESDLDERVRGWLREAYEVSRVDWRKRQGRQRPR